MRGDYRGHVPSDSTSLPGLALARSGLERRAERRTTPGLIGALLAAPATKVLPLRAGRAPIIEAEGRLALGWRPPAASDADCLVAFLGEGVADGVATDYVAVVEEGQAPEEDPAWRTLRQVGVELDDLDAGAFACALALANWHAAHGFCSRCGHETAAATAGWTRRCPKDGSEHFPRTDPAVIMAVIDAQDRILLARGAGFTAAGMSVLAGFVEPGETLAAAVAREVREEVGLQVSEVTYLGDQPWPFPSSLMIGFLARTQGSELTLIDGEIEAARWFSREELLSATASGALAISGRLSIARRLIEHWFGGPIDAPERVVRVR